MSGLVCKDQSDGACHGVGGRIFLLILMVWFDDVLGCLKARGFQVALILGRGVFATKIR